MKKDRCIYICVCMHVCVCAWVCTFCKKNVGKNRNMMGLQETIMYADPLSALPFFEF